MASSDFKATAAVAIDGWVREREAVLRERRAAARMRCAVMHELDLSDPCDKPCASCADRAAEVHPLPQIKRPREVADPHEKAAVLWRIGKDSKGEPSLEYRFNRGVIDRSEPWRTFPNYTNAPWCLYTTGPRVALWAELFANPTELVDDDGSAGGSL